MTAALLISERTAAEFETRLNDILSHSPRQLEILRFKAGGQLSRAQIAGIEAAYYSRDVWEGTAKSALSPAAQEFWPIVDSAANLKWLAVFSSGTDHQQYQGPMRRGVRLTTGAGAQAEPVAVAAATGLLCLARRVPHWLAAQQRREWAPLRGGDVPPDLSGQTAVIVGVGHIGKMIARLLKALNMKTIGIRRKVAAEECFDEVFPLPAIDALLPKCDWLVLACPLTPETRGLVNARRLSALPKTAGLVNIARGEIVDEMALADALAGGRLSCAYLDVFSQEPLPRESPLWTVPNLLISPHNAGASTGTYRRGVEIFLRNLENYLRGQPLENEALIKHN